MPGIGFTISCTRYAAMSVQGTKVMVPVAKCNMSSKKKDPEISKCYSFVLALLCFSLFSSISRTKIKNI